MWRRIRIYTFGLGLGLILTWALVLRNRNMAELLAWTPSERVLNELRADSTLKNPLTLACYLQCNRVNSLNYEQLFSDGNVLFSESIPRGEHKMYRIETKLEDKRVLFADFVFSDTQIVLNDMQVRGENNSCDCNENE
jgi:hypothetical protein